MNACGHPVEELRVRPNGVRDCLVCRRERRRRAQERKRAAQLPLVFATASAQRDAKKLLGSAAVENFVMRALLEHGAGGDPGEDGVAFVPVAENVVAVVTRTRSMLSSRKAWLVLRLRHQRKE